MDIRKVKKLIELLEESGIAELEIREGEESVRISRSSQVGTAPLAAAPAQVAVPAAPAAAAPAASTESESSSLLPSSSPSFLPLLCHLLLADNNPSLIPFVYVTILINIKKLCRAITVKTLKLFIYFLSSKTLAILDKNFCYQPFTRAFKSLTIVSVDSNCDRNFKTCIVC